MRIEQGVRAALTILVLLGVGAAGCSDSSPKSEGAVTVTGPSPTSPSPTSPSPSTTTEPSLAFEGVEADNSADGKSFLLNGYIRNTGTKTATFGVLCMASDNGIAVMSQKEATLAVPSLEPGLASKFEITTPMGDFTSVTWTYWGVVNGTASAKKYTISYEPVVPPSVAFEAVTATLEVTDFHLKGTLKNTGTITTRCRVAYEAKDGAATIGTGSTALVTPLLSPGASSTFDQALPAGAHVKVEWTYWAECDGGDYTTSTNSINFP